MLGLGVQQPYLVSKSLRQGGEVSSYIKGTVFEFCQLLYFFLYQSLPRNLSVKHPLLTRYKSLVKKQMNIYTRFEVKVALVDATDITFY